MSLYDIRITLGTYRIDYAILSFDDLTALLCAELRSSSLCFSLPLQILLLLSLQLLIDFSSPARFIAMTSRDRSRSHRFLLLLLIRLRGSRERVRD
jgi:hypothetical protein